MRGGAVLVAIRNELRSSRKLSLEGEQSEHLMIELYPANCTKFMLGVFYRPPNSDANTLMELRDSLDRLEESCQLVLVGDFNLPNIDWSMDFPSPTSQAGFKEDIFCDIIADQFLYQKVEGPTHLLGNKLDCVLCNVPELVTNVNCVNPTDLFPSDHYLIDFDIKLCFEKAKPVRRTVYDFKNADFNGAREYLLYAALDSSVTDDADVDTCWRVWKDLFLSAIDQFVPTKTVIDTNTPPWIDREVRHLINKKYTALRRYRQKRTEERKHKLRKLTQETKNLIKLKREQYLEKVQESFTKSPKSFWSYHKHILRNRNSPPANTYNNVTATTPDKKAELFNKYFASVFLPRSTSNNADLIMSSKTDQELSQIQISEYEVEQCLNNLDTSKAYGPDGIPPRLLKECSKEISPSLCRLFNKSLATGCVPVEWKQANVLPIHKKNCVEPVTNYRPISLLSIVSKVLERCVFNNIYPFVHALINNVQHGFLRNRSCVTQLLGVLHDIGKNLDQNKQVDMLYLDFSKAFDSVDHDILLYKLQKHGINGVLLRWFESYLNDRWQRVVIEGAASTWSPVTSGVPQGSILGPLLFIIFINDLPDNVSYSTNSALYADDSKLYREVTSISDCQSLQDDLTELEKWSIDSRMKFNTEKCKVLTVTRKHTPLEFSYQLYGNKLLVCKEEKDLGILVSRDLKWGAHILNMVAKANRMLGLLKRTCLSITNIRVRRSLFLTLVKSQLAYGSEVWCPSSRSQLSKKIEGVQRRATLWILGIKRGDMTYVERLIKLKLIPLVYDRERKDIVFYFKCKNNLIDLDISQYVETMSSRTRASTSCLLRTALCRTSTFKNSYFVRIVKLWNYVSKSAPSNCQNTLSNFKTYLHKTYLNLTVTSYTPDESSSHSLISTN
jgi:hypothetical protein